MKRPILLIAIATYVGSLLASKFGFGAYLVCILCFALIFGLIKLFKVNIKLTVIIFMFVGMFCSTGMFLIHNTLIVQPVEELDGKTVHITGIVSDYPSTYDNAKISIPLDHIKVDGQDTDFSSVITTYADNGAQLGNTFSGEVEFYALSGDSENSYKSEGIFVRGFTSDQYTVSDDVTLSINYFAQKASHFFSNIFTSRLGPDEAAVITAMFLGDKSQLDEVVKQDFISSGIADILVLSGAQISILIAAFSAFICKLSKFKVLNYILTLVFLWSFVIMVGASFSVLRPAILATLTLTALLIKRESDGLNSLGIAMLIITLFNPLSAYSIGYLLSILATAGIIILSPKFTSAFKNNVTEKIKSKPLSGALNTIFSIFALSLSATIFTAPITIIYFRQFSTISPFISVLITPFVQITMVMALISCFFALIHLNFIVNVTVFLTALSTKVILLFSNIYEHIPYSHIVIDGNYINVIMAFIAILIATYLLIKAFLEVDSKKIIFNKTVALFCAIILLTGVFTHNLYNKPLSSVATLDVGNGVSVVVQHKGKTMLVGCGGDISAAYNIKSYLKEQSIEKIDLLVLPQLNEMYASAADEIIAEYEVDYIMLDYDDNYKSEIEHYNNTFKNKMVYTDEDINFEIDDFSLTMSSDYVYFSVYEKYFLVTEPCATLEDSDFFNSETTIITGNSVPNGLEVVPYKEIIISGDNEYAPLAQYKLNQKSIYPYVTAEQGNVVTLVNHYGNSSTRRVR